MSSEEHRQPPPPSPPGGAAPVRRVRLARLARQLSQDQLAEAAGITRQAVAGFEAGRFDPSLKVALRLARVLGVSVEELFGADSQPAQVPARLVEPAPTEPRGRPGARVQLVEVAGRRWAFPLGGDTTMSWGFGSATGRLAHGTSRAPSAVPAARAAMPGEAPSGSEMAVEGPSPPDEAPSGSEVAVTVLGRPRPTVVVAGCDPALPLLAGPLAHHEPPVDLLWWPCSSGRALELVRAGTVHAAGAHLRDPAGSSYNTHQTRSVLGGTGAAVIGFASWAEGLALAPAQTGVVHTLADVARLGLRLVNREPGAEARAVLERERRRHGLALRRLAGWEVVLGGHFQIAAALSGGLADAGVTCEPAARAYGLGFLPLADEQFDLVVPRALLGTLEVRALLGALGSDELHGQLSAIDGYDPAACGTVLDSF